MPPSFDTGLTIADRMRRHAADHGHLYGHLMRAMADDWEAGGPVREICRGWEDAPPGSVLQLRLLAGLFRIVLTDRAPQLVRFYPCLGGAADPALAWPAVREVLAAHIGELHEALEVAPQTNEVGRSAALLVGLFEAVRRSGLSRVRLLEPGASGGLNLLVDRFRFVNPGWSFGPADSPLVLQHLVVGDVQPEDFVITGRRGCDLSPVDTASPDGRLRLRSFVWPFQIERHRRLSAALAIAADHPVEVDQSGAGEWLERQLERRADDDVLTVVWQSITRMYWPDAEVARVNAALESAAARIPLAHVAMEYPGEEQQAGADLTVDGCLMAGVARQGGRVQVAKVGDHGFPVTIQARTPSPPT